MTAPIARLREIWKRLRETAVTHGFGRTELIPLKHSGLACARYLTKYLAKAFDSEKSVGEEKCRLFGTWGAGSDLSIRLSYSSRRESRKSEKSGSRKTLRLDDPCQLKIMLRPHWWFHLETALSEVILRDVGEKQWDKLGLNACARDWARWPGLPNEDLAQQSRFSLLHQIGRFL